MTNHSTHPQTGILVSTDLTAGAADEGYQSQQHAEGIVVSTDLTAGAAHDQGYESQQHAEGLVR